MPDFDAPRRSRKAPDRNLAMLALLLLLAILSPGRLSASLTSAAKRGDLAEARRLLERGVPVDEPSFMYGTPLFVAIAYGHQEMVELLIAKGADVNQRTKYEDFTPLHYTIMYAAKKELVEVLLARGANPLLKNSQGDTPRTFAEKAGRNDLVPILLAAERNGPRRLEPSVPDAAEEQAFARVAEEYRTAATKPPFPEEARRFQVQAELAIREKRFDLAAELYGKALAIAPWWPEGHFNRAIVLGENRYFVGAIREAKRYLALVPDAADARAVQNKIYEWELQASIP